jgi:hypothetical protein
MVPVLGSNETDAAVTGVEAGAGPVTMNVVGVTVVGFMRNPDGTVKVALMAAAAHTPVALAAGLVRDTDTFPGTLVAAAVKVHT